MATMVLGVSAAATTKQSWNFFSKQQLTAANCNRSNSCIDAAACPVSVAAAHCATSGLQQQLSQAAREQPVDAAVPPPQLSPV